MENIFDDGVRSDTQHTVMQWMLMKNRDNDKRKKQIKLKKKTKQNILYNLFNAYDTSGKLSFTETQNNVKCIWKVFKAL